MEILMKQVVDALMQFEMSIYEGGTQAKHATSPCNGERRMQVNASEADWSDEW